MSETAKASIDRQAAYLKEHPDISVTIEGYSSENEDAREGLGVLAGLRANQVRTALTERGVAGSRVQTAAHGSMSLPGGSEAQDRRVLVVRRN